MTILVQTPTGSNNILRLQTIDFVGPCRQVQLYCRIACSHIQQVLGAKQDIYSSSTSNLAATVIASIPEHEE
jgi:hypothetical protein